MTDRKVQAVYIQIHFDDGSSTKLKSHVVDKFSVNVYPTHLDLQLAGMVGVEETQAPTLPAKVFDLNYSHVGMYVVGESFEGTLKQVEKYYGESRLGDEIVTGVRLTVDEFQVYFPEDRQIQLRRQNDT